MLASDGMLYGTTRFGRSTEANGTGTIYRLNPDGSGFTIIYRFAPYTTTNQETAPINTDGAFPEAELIEGSDGYLYGTTRAGGANGTGVIFKVLHDGTDFRVLYQFAAITSTADSGLTVTADGASPVAPLLQYDDGLFYGTTSTGGANGRGTIFRLASDGSGFQTLHTFGATTAGATAGLLVNADGATPLAGLTAGPNGNLYGVASAGGVDGAGVVFAMTPDGVTHSVMHHFNVNNGERPVAELLLGSDGSSLYGTTFAGGQNASGTATTFGTIFTIAADATGFTSLYSFDGSEGSAPVSRLIELASGKFVSATSTSGECGYGTIFQYSATGETVAGNTKCGRSRNSNNPYGSGSVNPALLVLLLGGLGWVRRRRD